MKFIVYVLSPLIALLLIIVKIPDFEKWIKEQNEYMPYIISGILVIGTLFNYYLTVFSPYKILEKLGKKKWQILAERMAMLNADYGGKYSFNCNIMIPKTRCCYRLEPSTKDGNKLKFTMVGKIFKVIWASDGSGVHPKLKITVNQGACGDAYTNGAATTPQNIKGAILTPDRLKEYEFKFNEQQKKLTKDLIIVVSCPLIIKEKGMKDETLKRIGVLNIESKVPASEILLTDTEQQKEFYVKIAALSNLYLNLHV
jgi:hypothetical protein